MSQRVNRAVMLMAARLKTAFLILGVGSSHVNERS